MMKSRFDAHADPSVGLLVGRANSIEVSGACDGLRAILPVDYPLQRALEGVLEALPGLRSMFEAMRLAAPSARWPAMDLFAARELPAAAVGGPPAVIRAPNKYLLASVLHAFTELPAPRRHEASVLVALFMILFPPLNRMRSEALAARAARKLCRVLPTFSLDDPALLQATIDPRAWISALQTQCAQAHQDPTLRELVAICHQQATLIGDMAAPLDKMALEAALPFSERRWFAIAFSQKLSGAHRMATGGHTLRGGAMTISTVVAVYRTLAASRSPESKLAALNVLLSCLFGIDVTRLWQHASPLPPRGHELAHQAGMRVVECDGSWRVSRVLGPLDLPCPPPSADHNLLHACRPSFEVEFHPWFGREIGELLSLVSEVRLHASTGQRYLHWPSNVLGLAATAIPYRQVVDAQLLVDANIGRIPSVLKTLMASVLNADTAEWRAFICRNDPAAQQHYMAMAISRLTQLHDESQTQLLQSFSPEASNGPAWLSHKASGRYGSNCVPTSGTLVAIAAALRSSASGIDPDGEYLDSRFARHTAELDWLSYQLHILLALRANNRWLEAGGLHFIAANAVRLRDKNGQTRLMPAPNQLKDALHRWGRHLERVVRSKRLGRAARTAAHGLYLKLAENDLSGSLRYLTADGETRPHTHATLSRAMKSAGFQLDTRQLRQGVRTLLYDWHATGSELDLFMGHGVPRRAHATTLAPCDVVARLLPWSSLLGERLLR